MDESYILRAPIGVAYRKYCSPNEGDEGVHAGPSPDRFRRILYIGGMRNRCGATLYTVLKGRYHLWEFWIPEFFFDSIHIRSTRWILLLYTTYITNTLTHSLLVSFLFPLIVYMIYTNAKILPNQPASRIPQLDVR